MKIREFDIRVEMKIREFNSTVKDKISTFIMSYLELCLNQKLDVELSGKT